MISRIAVLILLGVAATLLPLDPAAAQRPEVRRAEPVDSTPVPRALPVDDAELQPPSRQGTPVPTPRKALPVAPVPVTTPTPRPAASPSPAARPKPAATAPPSSPPPPASSPASAPPENGSAEPDSADQRQLDYANALFNRKLYDLAVPEYEKFLGMYPNASGRAGAYFFLGQAYRALNRTPAARSAFQSVLNEHADSEFAGAAAYGVAEILFNQKEYAGALPLFQKAAAKAKEAPLVLSAKYFVARSLESLDRKDEAVNAYLQVIEARDPNPYREDSRMAAGSLLMARGRKAEAMKQYEALAAETGKAPLKAEATVRAAGIAFELAQTDKAMLDKAMTLLKKGRSLPEAGKWRGIAEVGLMRLLYQTGQQKEVLAEYAKGKGEHPDNLKPEMLLLVANSHRQLGNPAEAEKMYAQIISQYPDREEAREARYQRLINIYNSRPDELVAEVDQFLASNPTAERADQAKLLKAEAFYKQDKFAEAAPLYEGLRASQLAPKLRAEAAYKLGWCYVQMKDPQRAADAFGYFVKGFAENPQVPTALMQKAIAHQEMKDPAGAIAALDMLLTKYPNAPEREAALQQKALLLGAQGDDAAMTAAFRQLLKEYPKTAAAAQAQYYIGKAAFEAKNYKAAIAPLNEARKLNKEQYDVPATLRIMSAHFYQKNRAELAAEADRFLAEQPGTRIPADILQWLGIEAYNEKDFAAAEKYLSALGAQENSGVNPEFWFYLAEAQAKLGRFEAAEASYQRFLQTSDDPAAKVKTLLALGAAKIAAHKADDAQRIAEEIMRLQPEGKVNAEARLLAGDVQMERGQFEEAGRAFMSVALLYQDPAITPRALQKAATAYQKAGKTAEAEKAMQQLRASYPEFAGG